MHLHINSHTTTYDIDYHEAEEQFNALIHLENLDRHIVESDSILEPFEETLDIALKEAFAEETASLDSSLFLQRVLYRINRLKLFWYDDLKNYTNEASPYLTSVRSRIETAWQDWELSHLDIESLQTLPVKDALQNRVAEDLSPDPSEAGLYFRDEMTEAGYRRFLGIASLDGLVEASQLSRILGGVGNEVQSMLTRILLEEYGGGRLARKHSSFFSAMLREFGMNPEPEAYFDITPWEVLVNTNHSFVLCELKRNFLRYVGGLLYTEISVPASFKNYSQAGERLGLSKEATGYWDLHIKEDQRHGRWMLEDVAFPLVDKYGESAWEIIWGYDQQRFISARASQAIVQSLREMESV
jgi:hypothetical protein